MKKTKQTHQEKTRDAAELRHYLVAGNTLENFRASATAFEARNKHRRSIWR